MKNFSLLTLSLFLISIINAQNVGIGTNTPAFPLHVASAQKGITQTSLDGKVQIGFYTQNNGLAFLQTHSRHNLSFSTADGVAHMTLDTVGNLGIGVTTPTAKLHVSGNSIFAGNVKATSLSLTSGAGAGKVLTSDGTGNATWQTVLKIGFHVRGIDGNGASVIAPNVYSKVHFDIANADYGGNYRDITQTPSSSFIVPVNGFYHFGTSVEISDFDGTFDGSNYFNTIGIRIVAKRGTGNIVLVETNVQPAKITDGRDDHNLQIATDVRVLAGDAVFVEIFQSNRNNANANIGGTNPFCTFSGYLIFAD